jgi:hypothetical protein
MIVPIFYGLVVAHIIVGVVGLISFWGVIGARKGGADHRAWGFRFAYAMLATGAVAILISLCSLADPLATHKDFTDAALARGLFGWMMLYLALLTLGLGWHALAAVRLKADHARHRNPVGVGLQLATVVAAVNCAAQGLSLGQPLMIGIATIGLASGALTLWFIAQAQPSRTAYVLEHIRSGVGAGISAYTAFLSVGLVRAFPEHAFNPLVWAAPTIFGVGLILFHQLRARRATPTKIAT